ncbi:helix-turn-helix domain-containing protein [Lachnoclostridium sp. An118]
MAKLGENNNVSTEVLCKICGVLNCVVDDIVEFMPNSEDEVGDYIGEER